MTQQVQEVGSTIDPGNGFMWAMVAGPASRHLMRIHVPLPYTSPDDLLVRVTACGICELDGCVVDGILRPSRSSVIPGHAAVGHVVAMGHEVTGFAIGDRVGVPRLGGVCGECDRCRRGLEHRCRRARLVGQTVDGGLAEYVGADHRFAVHLPGDEPDTSLAPLLCEGAIAFRALRAAGDAKRVGIYGTGGAAGLAARLARLQGREVSIRREREVAVAPPESLDGAIVFAPAQELFADALRAVVDGATVVRVSGAPSQTVSVHTPLLEGERQVRGIAGFTRRDLEDLLAFAATVRVRPSVEVAPLVAAEEELARIASGRVTGSAVLRIAES
ncbi:MAG TPA: alcohol dehydrogenase catalytic domain-containing protein [Candidatus Eisenbacteria bacterium]|nr:alcohol dehydrogenase catalytic domain-containing protein [Candidatus Eisenbacteria bacterium]